MRGFSGVAKVVIYSWPNASMGLQTNGNAAANLTNRSSYSKLDATHSQKAPLVSQTYIETRGLPFKVTHRFK